MARLISPYANLHGEDMMLGSPLAMVRPHPALLRLLLRLGGKVGESGASVPGGIAKLGRAGRLSRPWPGWESPVRPGTGRVPPKSPFTWLLEE